VILHLNLIWLRLIMNQRSQKLNPRRMKVSLVTVTTQKTLKQMWFKMESEKTWGWNCTGRHRLPTAFFVTAVTKTHENCEDCLLIWNNVSNFCERATAVDWTTVECAWVLMRKRVGEMSVMEWDDKRECRSKVQRWRGWQSLECSSWRSVLTGRPCHCVNWLFFLVSFFLWFHNFLVSFFLLFCLLPAENWSRISFVPILEMASFRMSSTFSRRVKATNCPRTGPEGLSEAGPTACGFLSQLPRSAEASGSWSNHPSCQIAFGCPALSCKRSTLTSVLVDWFSSGEGTPGSFCSWRTLCKTEQCASWRACEIQLAFRNPTFDHVCLQLLRFVLFIHVCQQRQLQPWWDQFILRCPSNKTPKQLEMEEHSCAKHQKNTWLLWLWHSASSNSLWA